MKALIAAATLLASSTAFALPVSVSDQQAITTRGQSFDFNFTGLANSGTGGQFSITLNGDYSNHASESAVSSNGDFFGGLLDLGSGTNGIITNTIAGLTYNSYSRTKFSSNDIEHSWVFDISDSLLNSMLSDGAFSVNVKNDSGVNLIGMSNPDFVRVGLSYNTATTSVPEPASLAFLGLGLAGLGLARRKQAKKA